MASRYHGVVFVAAASAKRARIVKMKISEIVLT